MAVKIKMEWKLQRKKDTNIEKSMEGKHYTCWLVGSGGTHRNGALGVGVEIYE